MGSPGRGGESARIRETAMTTAEKRAAKPASAASGCPECAGRVEIGFGPYGFQSTCGACGAVTHLDDMLEPLNF